MKQIIVVGTRPDRIEQLTNCWNSIESPYLKIAVDCNGYEVGKLRWVLKNTNADEFVFLQDSVEIKDNSIFKICSCQSGFFTADVTFSKFNTSHMFFLFIILFFLLYEL